MSDLQFLVAALGVVAFAAWSGVVLANLTERFFGWLLSDEPDPALGPCLDGDEA